ncbi:sensor histidine kinase [Actinomadura mexicana]|uniref:histidine kinase n=1 Tax=Actinomadura mexicana TaxID=134959 RepID=A0A238ZAG9_9ACTN|nr:sensor histidine kinase [Actinomadura mexicana]SNR80280.1 Signal transduction histidine kinase [Actinomadura mexicana]
MNDSAAPGLPPPAPPLPSRPRALPRRPSRTALVKDVLLYGVLAFPIVAGMLSPPQPARTSWWLQAAGLGALGAAIAAGRAWPAPALLTVIALTLVHGNFVFAMPVLSYLAGLRSTRAQPLLWGFTGVFVGGALLSAVRGTEVTAWFPSTVWLVLLGVLPWLVGRYWRQYQELLRAGWERAERLEHQQRIVAERERLRERARIAQDMHDSLGHELALIAVRAGALEVAPGLQDRHRAAAAELRTGAADATDHLREIIGLLNDDDAVDPAGPAGGRAPAPPPARPARESIPDLVDRARASGVPVRLTGDRQAHAGLAPMAALTAHRVVQEAITNAAKHAPGAAVTVAIAPTAGGTTVTVANDPPPDGPPLLPSGGRGLTGLTDRVRVLGGTLHAGPTPDGGFRVSADLPAGPPARDPAADSAADRAQARPTARDALRTALGLTPAAGEWPSESARHLARERRQVRRGLITAIAAPTALMAALGAIMAGYYVFVTLNSVLHPADYGALAVGDPQHRVERALPPMQTPDTGTVRAAVPEPAGADCRYYRPDANVLGVGRIYRLCFAAGRLIAKNAYDTQQLSAQRTHDQEDQ